MDRRLATARVAAAAAAVALVPTVVLAVDSRLFTAIAVIEAAILAISTMYAVYVGLYRYHR
jgi:hypothetical protein